jgi:hypothetical protein
MNELESQGVDELASIETVQPRLWVLAEVS